MSKKVLFTKATRHKLYKLALKDYIKRNDINNGISGICYSITKASKELGYIIYYKDILLLPELMLHAPKDTGEYYNYNSYNSFITAKYWFGDKNGLPSCINTDVRIAVLEDCIEESKPIKRKTKTK